MKNLEDIFVMVVDANEDMRELLCRFLIRCGLPSTHIIEFQESIRARDFLKSIKVDLVIANRMQPELSGVELARSIRANEKIDEVLIIITTCSEDNNDIVCAGAGFLQIPFTQQNIYDVMLATQILDPLH